MTNSEGEIVWQGQYSAWGYLQRQTRPTSTFNREQTKTNLSGTNLNSACAGS
ncbi:RHS domain-containing protein [Proteus mirabilis]|uniref:RHS domain-containing protein n=1 Tax=Proteus mirabilis TaxID=584 RepID=UPI0022E06836|nr:RHS domain-containing protein [Proteus mirabilis]